MKRTLLMSLLLSLNALPVHAAEPWLTETVFGQALPMVAQLSPEERRSLRERWEQAAPDERATLRREFRERLRQVPPEGREILRQELMHRWQGPVPENRDRVRSQDHRGQPAEATPRDNGWRGFGRGFERRFENGDPDQAGRR